MRQPFCYLLRVRYSECDAQQVVFNARYGDYTDLATVEFLRAALPQPQQLFNGQFDYQLVKQSMEWRAPAHFDDVLAIHVICTHTGRTSFTLNYEFRRHGEDDLLANASTIFVRMSAGAGEKMMLDEEETQALRAGASECTTDHAGLSS